MNLRFVDIVFILGFLGAIILFLIGATGPILNQGSKVLPEELLIYCILPLGITFITVVLSKVRFLSLTAILCFLVMAVTYGKMLLIP